MRMRSLLVGLAAASLLSCGAVAWADAEEAAREFANGQTLLAKGEFAEALTSFKAAAKADPENREYFQEAAILHRVIQIRERLAGEKDAEDWAKLARALYGYYQSRKVYGEGLSLAEALHEKLNTDETAVSLADAQLALDKNQAALTLLSGLDESKGSARADALRGVALARLDKLAEAKACATALALPKECDWQDCYDAARLYALVGERDKALRTLVCCFETTPPARLDALKAEAKDCKDLCGLADGDDFAKVMTTQSKIKGGCGGCSGGKTCTKGAAGCGEQSKDKAGSRSGKSQEKPAGCTGHK